MPIDEITFEAEEKMDKAVDVLGEKYGGLRVGRANPGLVENLRIEYYGSPTPLKQLANIAAPEPQFIVIRPFDPNSCKDIEKALLASDIGITPNNDGKFIRLAIPPLSEERRTQVAVQARTLAEEAKVAIRNIRREANKDIDKEEKDKLCSEDEAYGAKEEVQELTKQYEEKVDELQDKKSAEIMEIRPPRHSERFFPKGRGHSRRRPLLVLVRAATGRS